MIAAQHHGGLVLGAYDGRRMVGVLFGITGVDKGRPYHYSHITGVAKEYQSKGIGFKLKLAQREHVMKRGEGLVRWTYDPLQAGNAYFNIRKLGTICRIYHRDLYGQLDDSLNRGRFTDRFEVEWHVKSKRVRERMGDRLGPGSLNEELCERAEPVNQTREIHSRLRVPSSARLNLSEKRLLVEIPSSIVRVRDASARAANTWTLHARRIFENYFQRGYMVTDVAIGDAGRRVFYLLENRAMR